MTRGDDDASSRTVGIGAAAELLGVSVAYVRTLANDGVLSSTVTSGGHRRFDPRIVREEWADFRSSHPGRSDWRRGYDLHNLREDDVWADVRSFLGELPRNVYGILAYAVTEMVNNAIDHSGGTEVTAIVTRRESAVEVRIADDGVGAFARMAEGLGLGAPKEALVEVTKGKRTTAPDRHAGEGLFFTLRAADMASVSANGYIVVASAAEGDDRFAWGSARGDGTTVVVRVNLDTTRTLLSVFEEFAPTDAEGVGGFTKTAPRVSLVTHSGDFISRSEAKRFAAGLEKFETVILDFAGLDLIGQGFADELFRVWQREHPDVELHIEGASRGVRLMIERARSNAE